MPLSTSVKWYSGKMTGLPYDGSFRYRDAFTVKEVLSACLTNGFNAQTLDSIVVTDGVATCTRANGHGFLQYQVITISGATPSSLNGDHRVTVIASATEFTFEVDGVSDGTASGTITVKATPAGWQVNNAGTYDTTLKSNGGLGSVIQMQANGTNITVKAYEDWTALNTGTLWGGAVSTNGPSDARWTMCDSTAAAEDDWLIVADDKTIYFRMMSAYANTSLLTRTFYGFGNFTSFYPNDPGAEFIQMLGNGGEGYYTTMQRWGVLGHHTGDGYAQARRSASGVMGSRLYALQTGTRASGSIDYADSDDAEDNGETVPSPAFPSPVDNGLVFQDWVVRDIENGNPIRGKLRGIYWLLASQPFQMTSPPTIIDGVSGLEGRKLAVEGCGWPNHDYRYVSQDVGHAGVRFLIDIIGPWD